MRMFVAAAAAVISVLTGCLPPPGHLSRLPAVTSERHVYGDSISVLTMGSNLTARTWHANVGWDLTQWLPDILATMATRPAVIHLALGTNDAGIWEGRDGWTAADEAAWSQALDAAIDGTCVIIELPYVTSAAEATWPGIMAQVDTARAWLRSAGAQYGAVVSDWAEWGWFVLVDGIHPSYPEGVAQRLAQMDNAEAQCP